jgi:hypothetical protein
MLSITSCNHIFYLIHKKHSNYYGFYNYIYNTTSSCKTSVTHVKNPAKNNCLQVLAYSIVTRKQLKYLASWAWIVFPEAMFRYNYNFSLVIRLIQKNEAVTTIFWPETFPERIDFHYLIEISLFSFLRPLQSCYKQNPNQLAISLFSFLRPLQSCCLIVKEFDSTVISPRLLSRVHISV